MIESYIKAISYILPQQAVTNADLAKEFPEWTVEKIASKIGIDTRYVASDAEDTATLATNAGNKLFEEHNIDRSIIDFVLLCTQSPDYFLPTTACIVQHKLNLSTNCGALDFNLGCSGYIYGLSIAKGLIAAGVAKNILFITAETYNKYIHPKDKSNRTIFGDAAAATLISDTGSFLIQDFILGTDGKGAENLIVKNGASKFPEKNNIVTFDENNNVVSDDNLYMNGSSIFEFTLDAVPKLVESTLEKNNLLKEQVDLFIFHQANKYMLNTLRKKIAIPEEKFFISMNNCGNTVSSTIPIAIYNAISQNAIPKQSKILLAGFGVGYSWGGVILES